MTEHTTHAQLAAEQRCKLARDGQAQTGAAKATLLARVGLFEGREDAFQVLGGDADAERLDALLRPVLDGEPSDFEFVGRRSGMHLSVQAVPVRDDRAGVIGVMAVCRDVTPRHEVAAALRGLAAEYDEQNRGFELREVAGGWRFYTRASASA